MNISGDTKRSVSDQTGDFNFDFDISFPTTLGTCSVGCSGDRNVAFKFSSGKIYDPNNKFIGAYHPNDRVFVHAQVSQSTINYYLNAELMGQGQPISSGKISYWYAHPSGVIPDLNIAISGHPPNYYIAESGAFQASGVPISGGIANLTPSVRFRIFNAYLQNFSPYYEVLSYPTGDISTSGNFVFRPTVDYPDDVVLPLTVESNFGTFTHNFSIKGKPDPHRVSYISVAADEFDPYSFAAYFSNYPSSAQMRVSLDYVSGVTGDVYAIFSVANFVTGFVSGDISGCEVISNYYESPITGDYDPHTMAAPTGIGSGYLYSDVVCGTGISTVVGSGWVTGDVLMFSYQRMFTGVWDLRTGDLSFRDNGFENGSSYFHESSFSGIGGNFLVGLSYNNLPHLGTVPDVARLMVSGVNFYSGVQLIIEP